MIARAVRSLSLDQMAIALSGLCLAHCLATAVLIALFASAGGVLLDPMIHEVGLALATILAGVALFRGYRAHGFARPMWLGVAGLGLMLAALIIPHNGMEAVLTMVGVGLVALAHDINRRSALAVAQYLP